MGVILTDLDELPSQPRRPSYLDPLLQRLGPDWIELVRGEGEWRESVSPESLRDHLHRSAALAGVGVATKTTMDGCKGLEEVPQRIWVRARSQT